MSNALTSKYCICVLLSQYFQGASGATTEHFFQLDLSQVEHWPTRVREFEQAHGYPVNGLRNLVYTQLEQYAFPTHILHAEETTSDVPDDVPDEEEKVVDRSIIYTHMAVKTLFHQYICSYGQSYSLFCKNERENDTSKNAATSHCNSTQEHEVLFSSEKNAFKQADPASIKSWLLRMENFYLSSESANNEMISKHSLVAEYSSRLLPSIVPNFLRSSLTFVIYQSLGAVTGGTIALELLHRQLNQLGYNSILCDGNVLAGNGGYNCSSPNHNDIVITGEWCNGVLEEHGPGPASFTGRGIQYHLGFHHLSDLCHGHVTVTDSHQLKALLSSRILSGYFLGCPMVDMMRELFTHLLYLSDDEGRRDEDSGVDFKDVSNLLSVKKENLIVLDMDILHDYPPHNDDISFSIPEGYRLLKLHDVPRHRMASILLRAKIIIDLAMPGPERLAGEAILLGAIPIVSKQWNGASDIDFPGIRKVDSLNNTEISEVLEAVAAGYPQELQSIGNSYFQGYIASLWQRLHNTADVYMGSASLQFVLTALTHDDEALVAFQTIGLLYLFPLANIDIYVRDDMWFTRQHYLFMTILKESGYVRYDRFDPDTFSFTMNNPNDGHHSFVRVKSIRELELVVAKASRDANVGDTDLRSSNIFSNTFKTTGIVIFLPRKFIPTTAEQIYRIAKEKKENLGEIASATKSSNILYCSDDEISTRSLYDELCGAVFLPDESVFNFVQSYQLITGLNLEDDMLQARNVKNTSQWRSVCELLRKYDYSDSTSRSGFVQSLLDTVPWQRLLKISTDLSILTNVCH